MFKSKFILFSCRHNLISNCFKDSTIANTGDALWHVHNNIFNTEYDRPDAENVLVLITDTLSSDDVEPAAKALKESGVTVGNA